MMRQENQKDSRSSIQQSCLFDVKLPFPFKLHEMLDEAESQGYDSIVSWLPHGKAFRVHQPKVFADVIMPRYFKQSKYKSFQRQLHIYGFRRINSKAMTDFGAYYHDKFIRGERDSSLMMQRQSSASPKTDAKTTPDPDFYINDTAKQPNKNNEKCSTDVKGAFKNTFSSNFNSENTFQVSGPLGAGTNATAALNDQALHRCNDASTSGVFSSFGKTEQDFACFLDMKSKPLESFKIELEPLTRTTTDAATNYTSDGAGAGNTLCGEGPSLVSDSFQSYGSFQPSTFCSSHSRPCPDLQFFPGEPPAPLPLPGGQSLDLESLLAQAGNLFTPLRMMPNQQEPPQQQEYKSTSSLQLLPARPPSPFTEACNSIFD